LSELSRKPPGVHLKSFLGHIRWCGWAEGLAQSAVAGSCSQTAGMCQPGRREITLQARVAKEENFSIHPWSNGIGSEKRRFPGSSLAKTQLNG